MNYFDLMEEHIQKIRKASGVTIENDITEQHRRTAKRFYEARAKQAEAKQKQSEQEKLKKALEKKLSTVIEKELQKIFK